MQHNAINEVQQWLPEIDPCQIELVSNTTEENYRKELNQITENLHSWAISVLEKANLPSAPHEAKALLDKYAASSDEGCALHVVIEVDAMHASINHTDASTTAIAGMKLFDAVWQRAIIRMQQPEQQTSEQDNTDTEKQTATQPEESAENIKLYQDTINELKQKYPHCNINALRLLASTRLHVTKQQLDDLDISPQ